MNTINSPSSLTATLTRRKPALQAVPAGTSCRLNSNVKKFFPNDRIISFMFCSYINLNVKSSSKYRFCNQKIVERDLLDKPDKYIKDCLERIRKWSKLIRTIFKLQREIDHSKLKVPQRKYFISQILATNTAFLYAPVMTGITL